MNYPVSSLDTEPTTLHTTHLHMGKAPLPHTQQQVCNYTHPAGSYEKKAFNKKFLKGAYYGKIIINSLSPPLQPPLPLNPAQT